MSININAPRIGFEIDVTPIVETLNFMYSAAKAIDESSDAGKRVSYASVERVAAAIQKDLYEEALKRQTELAHVFDWESVTDHTPATRMQHTKVAKKQGPMRRTPGSVGVPESSVAQSFHDTNAKFIPKIRPNLPLFRLRLKKQGNSSIAEVEFMSPSITGYDPIVQSSAHSFIDPNTGKHNRRATWGSKKGQFIKRPKPWGRHHFSDQAINLEMVNKIEKRSHPVSSRRLSGSSPGEGRDGRRIIQAFVGSGSDVNFQFFGTYTRANPYTGKFTRFFLQYASSKADQQAQLVLDNVQKDINKVYEREVKYRLAARQAALERNAAALMRASAGMALGPSGQLRVKPLRLTYYGKEVPSLPALQDKMSTELMQKILAEFRKSSQKDGIGFSQMSGRIGSSEKAARFDANQLGAML